MAIDPDDLHAIKAALEASTRVDANRIELEVRDDHVVLHGAAASPEEASAAAVIAERYGHQVVNELRIDRALQEGVERPSDVERAVPAENEVLLGSTDMLAGPEAETTTDMAQAFDENEPWIPPDAPIAVAASSEYRGDVSPGDGGPIEDADPDADTVARSEISAPDLTQQDLEAAARGAPVPSLDPDAVAPRAEAEPDPAGVDALGRTPPEELEPMAEQMPDTPQGPGATGEGTAGGGSISGTPATETGAAGADTASADPARTTGGTSLGTGAERGPQAREDPPLREDFPSAE